jgi:photosystem II stability/assembly factor-like uncharacterized protein
VRILKLVTIEYYSRRPKDYYRAFALLEDGRLMTQVFDQEVETEWSEVRAPRGIVELAPVRAAANGVNNEGVVAILRNGQIWVTFDCGATWRRRKGPSE